MSQVRVTVERSHASLGAALDAADRLVGECRDLCYVLHDGLRWHAVPRTEMPGTGRYVAAIRPRKSGPGEGGKR